MTDKQKELPKEISQKELVTEMILGMLDKWKEMLIVTLKHKEETLKTLGSLYDMIYESGYNKGNDIGYSEGFEDGYLDCEEDIKELTGVSSIDDLNQYKKLQEIGSRIGIEVSKMSSPAPSPTNNIEDPKPTPTNEHTPVLEKLIEMNKPSQN